MSTRPIVVIGAGIVGLACATYLRRDGHQVVVLERDEPGAGASQGNAGALSPGSCVPLAMPGVFGKIPGWLTDPQGPLTIAPSYFLQALPWLLRFTAAARPARVQQIATALRALHEQVYDCYTPLVRAARCEHLLQRTGTLNVYRSEAAFQASMSDWKIRMDRGGQCIALSGPQLLEVEPALSPSYTHAMLLPDHGYCANPWGLVRALAAQVQAEGVAIHRAEAVALQRAPESGWWVSARDGQRWEASQVVVAAGAWALPLLRSVGVSIPLESQRGYHVHLQDAGVQPRLPISVSEGKYYATPMHDGLRVAGTVEFAGLQAPPQFSRARRLLQQVAQLYPQVRTQSFTEWAGHRPCLPDSLPAIGSPRGRAGLWLALGHGHNGMTSGPVTGKLLSDLVAHRRPLIDPTPYSPDRF